MRGTRAIALVLTLARCLPSSAYGGSAVGLPPARGKADAAAGETTAADVFHHLVPPADALKETEALRRRAAPAERRCLAWLSALLNAASIPAADLDPVAAEHAIPLLARGHWESPKQVLAAAQSAQRVDGFVVHTQAGGRKVVLMETSLQVFVVVLPKAGEPERRSTKERVAYVRDVAKQLFAATLVDRPKGGPFPLQVAGLNDDFLYGVWEPVELTWPKHLPRRDCPAREIAFETDGRFIRYTVQKSYKMKMWATITLPRGSRFDLDDRRAGGIELPKPSRGCGRP